LWSASGGFPEFWRMTFLILLRLMAPLPSRLATPGSMIELVHSGDRESLHWRTAPTLTLPDDRLRCSSCFACVPHSTIMPGACGGDWPRLEGFSRPAFRDGRDEQSRLKR